MPTPFESFPLHPAVLAGLEKLDVGAPTAVQTHVIPLLMEGQDVVVHAGPHSGETLAYGLPLLSLFDSLGKAQVLVLVPSAERAIRVYKKLAPLAQGLLKLAPLYEAGGPQEQAVKRGVDVVIGTPYLVKDLFAIKQLDLNHVRMIVLDGADRMMTTVQRRDVEYLLDRLPRVDQTALFTWNVTEGVEAAIAHHLKNPAMVRLTPAPDAPDAQAAEERQPAQPEKAERANRAEKPEKAAKTAKVDKADKADATEIAEKAPRREKPARPEKVEKALHGRAGKKAMEEKKAARAVEAHRFGRVPSEQRADFLMTVLESEAPPRALVIARNKHEARRLVQKLEKLGRSAVDSINVDTSVNTRNTVLARFRAGELRFLVVPEQASRELDLGAPEFVYLTGLSPDPTLYARYAEAARASGGALRSLSIVTPEAEEVFQKIRGEIGFKRHPLDPGPADVAPAPAAVQAPVPVAAAAPAAAPKEEGRRARGGRGAKLAEAPVRSSATLLNDSMNAKATTGPLSPLPRMNTSWQTFKVSLVPGQRPSRDTFHGWLSQRTGIARSSLRSIQLYKGYATVDVEARQVARFQESLKDLLIG